MSATFLKKYFEIAKANVKHNFLPQVILSFLILILTPIVFGVTGLDAKASVVPLEMFISLIGMIMLTPIFAPEQNKVIRETVESKYTSTITVFFIRILISVVTIAILILLFMLFMRLKGCEVSLVQAYGTFASALFLGAVGLLAHGLSNNIAVGYMLPILYYAWNFTGGSKYLGKLYLFSMTHESYDEKIWLFIIGVLLIFLTLAFKKIALKVR